MLNSSHIIDAVLDTDGSAPLGFHSSEASKAGKREKRGESTPLTWLSEKGALWVITCLVTHSCQLFGALTDCAKTMPSLLVCWSEQRQTDWTLSVTLCAILECQGSVCVMYT